MSVQELTGKLPRDFPLEEGERPPFVQRRAGFPSYGTSKGDVSLFAKSLSKDLILQFKDVLA